MKEVEEKNTNKKTTPNNELIQKIKELESNLEESNQKRLQTMADFENYKKRIEGEKAMFGAIANMGLIKELLEVVDDINLALGDGSMDLKRAKDSLAIAKEKLIGATKIAGVEQVEIKVGDGFDSGLMEAVSTISDPKMQGKVVAVISSAYRYTSNSNMIKHAKVIVGK